ncbi:MAG TPA: tetratricopeptide repeat protein [Opitutaceae bacterium]
MAPDPTPEPAPAPSHRRAARSLLAKIALAVAAPVVVFCVLEGGLRLAGFGVPAGFFIPDEKPGFYRTNPSFTAPFMPASFGIEPLNFRIQKHKEPGTVRVFVLGESAAQGMPDPGFGFAAQLGAQLRARYPGRAFEVLNLGITAIDSHVVYQIARQLPSFEPDLLVVYMGNNEVVGPYGPGCAYMSANPPLWVIRASVWVRGTRSGQLLTRLLGKLDLGKSHAPEWKGMETFSQDSVRGDDPRLEAAYRNFSANLQDMVAIAARAGVKTVLSTVVSNLKDSSPFISLHRPAMGPADTKAWNEAYDAGTIAWDLGDGDSALYEFREAERIDPQFAEGHFRIGRLEEALGDTAAARAEFLEALHWDALRFRPDPRINAAIRQVALRSGDSVFLVDAAKELGSDPDSQGPLPGREILFDHVHFNWAGNFQVARLMANGCAHELSAAGAPAAEPDPAGVAAALGYTADGELGMLRVLGKLMLRPPFTSQSTFSVDQARMKKAVEEAVAQTGTAQAKSADIAVVAGALALDPGNASLALRLGTMESEAGDFASALEHLDRAEAFQPRSPDISWRKAQVLIRLRRYDEAEALLYASLGMYDEYFSAAGELAELWATTRQFDKGRKFFAEQLARAPQNHYLRLEYANLLALASDWTGAENEARQILYEDPSSRTAAAALELLIKIFEHQKRADAADALTQEAAKHQPEDYYNNQRLVRLYAARNEPSRVADALLAVAATGPFDAAQHLDLAHRMADLNRRREMLDELAQAREVARVEGDEAQSKGIYELIAKYRKRFSDGQVQ